MKRKLLPLLLLLFLCLFPLAAAAEETPSAPTVPASGIPAPVSTPTTAPAVASVTATATASATAPVTSPVTAPVTSPVTSPVTTPVTAPATGDDRDAPALELTPSGGLTEPERGLFAALAAFLEGSLGTLIGGATLSLLLALYLVLRRSLLPKLLSGGEAVFRRAQAASEQLCRFEEEAGERLGRYLEEAERVLREAERNGKSTASLAARLSSLEAECRTMEEVALYESEMLYHLLMSVSLPAYQKDEIAEVFASVKKSLSSNAKRAGTVSKIAKSAEKAELIGSAEDAVDAAEGGSTAPATGKEG